MKLFDPGNVPVTYNKQQQIINRYIKQNQDSINQEKKHYYFKKHRNYLRKWKRKQKIIENDKIMQREIKFKKINHLANLLSNQ